jgi:hypothetical protein
MMKTEYLKWLGTGFTIGGALLTSVGGLDPYNVLAFNLGALFWLGASIQMRDAALMAVNSALLAIYAVGTLIRLVY